MFSDDAFNKNILNDAGEEGAGTLIGNWAEERVLREATGEGRTVPQRHVPRSGLLQDFTKTPSVYKKGDDTFNRVYGPKSNHNPEPASRTIGAPDRHAGKIAHVGPLEQTLKAGRTELAENEVQEEEEIIAKQANTRRFDTTTGSVHCKPNELEAEKAEHARKSYKNEIIRGPTPDRTLAMQGEALDVPTHTHYSNAETLTHPRMCLSDPRMRSDLNASACGGVNAFGKHGEFSKNVLEFTRGLAKDEECEQMFHGLKGTNPLRHVGGHAPRGPFSATPSLATLKSSVHAQIAETWGEHGYVTLRQRLFDAGDHEAFVHKQDVVTIFRDQLGLSAQEVPDAMLDVYLGQLVTMKKAELRIGALMSSLRPVLPQKEKRRVLEAFKALNPVSGEIRLGDWLSQLQDDALRQTVVSAFGARDEEQVAGTALSEQVFMELFADLAPFMDIGALIA